MRLTPLLLLSCCWLSACGEKPTADYGVLVMAHGGSEDWDRSVVEAVEPLSSEFTVEIAFGMADAVSIQAGIQRLEERGCSNIGVVRLFISRESWYERTRQILGVAAGAPDRPDPEEHAGHDHGEHGEHGGHSMEFWKIETGAAFAVGQDGLADAPSMGKILEERAAALSEDPAREDVLLLAHGPGDDGENERWLKKIGKLAEAVNASSPFRRVEVMTLREDWPEKRTEAEERIRAFVAQAKQEDGRALVIPFRVSGFGPYKEVLGDLEYASDGKGLLPHDVVTEWIREQAQKLQTGPFASSEG